MADRRVRGLAGIGAGTVLLLIWLIAVNSYTRAFVDTALFQIICHADPSAGRTDIAFVQRMTRENSNAG